MKTKASQHNRFFRIITTPYRALIKARDFYVNSMINCANMNATGLQRTAQAPSLPRSFSVASSRSNDDNEDYRELVRAASARSSIGGRMNLDMHVTKMRTRTSTETGPRALPPRSISVAMGRIDEEVPSSYFGEESVDLKSELKYPRSKSHAVARTSF